jgi:LysR family glycine cleavage system transcriptional activator
MVRRLPSLTALRAFEAAARHLSFSRAADELHVTHAAVSHQIKALEAELGVALFRRLPRAVRLTEAGQAYFPPLRDAFASMTEATAALAVAREAGPLTISVAPSFATRWLVPNLHAFEARHPEIEVRSVISMHRVDLEAGDVAAAIRHGRGDWPGLTAHPLLAEELVPVCAPALLAGSGLGAGGFAGRAGERGGERGGEGDGERDGESDGDAPPLLHVEPRPDDWPTWFAGTGRSLPPRGAGPGFPTLGLALDAAVSGLGVAVADRRLVAQDIAQGRLARAASEAVPSDRGYFLVHPPARAGDPKLAAFREWLAETVAAADDGGPGA